MKTNKTTINYSEKYLKKITNSPYKTFRVSGIVEIKRYGEYCRIEGLINFIQGTNLSNCMDPLIEEVYQMAKKDGLI